MVACLASPLAPAMSASIAHKREQWMALHGRRYKDQTEKDRQLLIFSENIDRIDNFWYSNSYFLKLIKHVNMVACLASPLAPAMSASIAHKREQWMALHGRRYKDQTEKDRRLLIFSENIDRIDKFY
ncbi:hypothetical protein Q3G72_005231 [Acer saccharum]|nr:hypothetical protein Q3G72_005231 [Acer saccharum]